MPVDVESLLVTHALRYIYIPEYIYVYIQVYIIQVYLYTGIHNDHKNEAGIGLFPLKVQLVKKTTLVKAKRCVHSDVTEAPRPRPHPSARCLEVYPEILARQYLASSDL